MNISKLLKLPIFLSVAMMMPMAASANPNADVDDGSVTWATPALSPYLYAHNEAGAYSDVNIPHQFKRGMKHFNNGDYEKATFSFNRVLKKSARDPLTNYYMGVSEQHLGNHSQAVKHLTTVYKYYKASPQVYAALGTSLVATGDHEGARKLLFKLDYMASKCAGDCRASRDIDVARQILTKHVKKI